VLDVILLELERIDRAAGVERPAEMIVMGTTVKCE
jgi:hypothetical protein